MLTTHDTILVLSTDIDMMRAVLAKAGFDKRTHREDRELSVKAATLVMSRFRSGMVDADELLGELLFHFGRQERSRVEPPAPLPKYAIQGLPRHLCQDDEVKH